MHCRQALQKFLEVAEDMYCVFYLNYKTQISLMT